MVPAHIIELWQIKRIWAAAKAIGMTADDLHAMANKDSLKELSFFEANQVIDRLFKLQGNEQKRSADKNKHQRTAKCVSTEVQRKIWALMYELQKYDKEPSVKTVGERLCKIIKKELHIDCMPKTPFVWLSQGDSYRLVEIIKKYVENEQRKLAKGGG